MSLDFFCFFDETEVDLESKLQAIRHKFPQSFGEDIFFGSIVDVSDYFREELIRVYGFRASRLVLIEVSKGTSSDEDDANAGHLKDEFGDDHICILFDGEIEHRL